MTKKKEKQIIKEAKERLNTWLFYKSFEIMSGGFNYHIFKMSLGLTSDKSYLKDWWTIDFLPIVTEEEAFSVKYDKILKKLFDEQMQKNRDGFPSLIDK